MKKKILGASLGTCVHVSGLYQFLKLAEWAGYETQLLGPAVSPQRLIDAIGEYKPDIVAVSYRLTPEVGEKLFLELKELIIKNEFTSIKLVFGGTRPVALVAEKSGLFEKVFSGMESLDSVKAYLLETGDKKREDGFKQTLVERIEQKFPYPLIRHHFGRPLLEETIEGIKEIAESGVIDIISLGPDQNAQEHFFHPEEMDTWHDGAGGVPIRKREEMMALFEASRRGNFPLMRCYSGTRDLIKWAEMSVETINNAWGAIPLCWYNVIDGRSKRSLREAISENQQTMGWYAEKGIPVEVNESHQWSLRDAHDSLAVSMAYLAAYNAKKMGVRDYVSQYMFNTPPGTTPVMDIAKMLAKNELICTLEDDNFRVYREVRAGIAHFGAHGDWAKGQLAASGVISLALHPHILHVVGFSEGDHAVFPDELIESCNIIHGMLRDCLHGMPDFSEDKTIQKRKIELIEETGVLLDALKEMGIREGRNGFSDPEILASAIEKGLLDAPHFRGNKYLYGQITTGVINGGYDAMDPETGNRLTEKERIQKLKL